MRRRRRRRKPHDLWRSWIHTYRSKKRRKRTHRERKQHKGMGRETIDLSHSFGGKKKSRVFFFFLWLPCLSLWSFKMGSQEMNECRPKNAIAPTTKRLGRKRLHGNISVSHGLHPIHTHYSIHSLHCSVFVYQISSSNSSLDKTCPEKTGSWFRMFFALACELVDVMCT